MIIHIVIFIIIPFSNLIFVLYGWELGVRWGFQSLFAEALHIFVKRKQQTGHLTWAGTHVSVHWTKPSISADAGNPQITVVRHVGFTDVTEPLLYVAISCLIGLDPICPIAGFSYFCKTMFDIYYYTWYWNDLVNFACRTLYLCYFTFCPWLFTV